MTDQKIRRISIWPKTTQAHTQYWSMQDEDRAWLMSELVTFMSQMQEHMTHERSLRSEMYRQRPRTYPRGRQGANSHASMIGGITLTLLEGRDITTHQLDAIETVMDLAHVLTDHDTVRWQRELWEVRP